MKKLLAVALALALSATPAFAARPGSQFGLLLLLNGTPEYVDTTASTSPTAATITATAGGVVKLQCDAATYVYVPGTASSTNGEKVAADQAYYVILPDSDATISILAVTGTVNCKRWNMT